MAQDHIKSQKLETDLLDDFVRILIRSHGGEPGKIVERMTKAIELLNHDLGSMIIIHPAKWYSYQSRLRQLSSALTSILITLRNHEEATKEVAQAGGRDPNA